MIVSSAMGLGGLVRDWSGAENVGADLIAGQPTVSSRLNSNAMLRRNLFPLANGLARNAAEFCDSGKGAEFWLFANFIDIHGA